MTLVPVENLVQPVANHDDLFQFRYDFTLGAKAVDDQVVTEMDNGDLLIEGYAAVFDGLDREGENFVPGAFQEGIKSFIGGQAALCHHHKHDQVIGRVAQLEEHDGKGLWMQARVDKQEPTSPLYHVYNGIKKGSINGLSVGGFFKRSLVKARQMISGVDFTEISVTGVPVHSGTNFAVVAGKALEGGDKIRDIPEDPELPDFADIFERFNTIFETINGEKALPDGHDPETATHVRNLLNHVQAARQHSTYVVDSSQHSGLKGVANQMETDLSAHEAKLHKLAAKVGPLTNHFA